MVDKLAGILYLVFILLLTVIHDITFYILVLAILIVLSGKSFFILAKKTLLAVLFFNLFISISYLVLKGFEFDYLILVNMRVIDMTFMTFLFVNKINLFKLFSFSKNLTYLLVLSYSQILVFERYFNEFSLALKSRLINKPSYKQKKNFITAVLTYFTEKSVENSREIAQAMKSRGFL